MITNLVGKKQLYDILVNSISINCARVYSAAPIDKCAYHTDSKSEILTVPIGCGSSASAVIHEENIHIYFHYSAYDRFRDYEHLTDIPLSEFLFVFRGL